MVGQVEKFLEFASAQRLVDFKVLVLGAGESGKSTVIKQLKSIYKVCVGNRDSTAIVGVASY